MHIAELIVRERMRRRLTRAQLAIRARVDEHTVERVESGELAPDPELTRRLALALGVQLIQEDGELRAEPLRGRYDPVDLAAARARPIDRRLADAFSWNRFTSSLAGTAREPPR